MKLKEISDITVGLNSQRLKAAAKDNTVYTANDLTNDLSAGYRGKYVFSDKERVDAGDVVFHLMSATSAVVSEANAGKLMSQNILKFQFDRSKVDAWYFCYVLNEAQSIKHQLHNMKEGTVTKLITPATIKNLHIDLPDIELQKQIGSIYSTMLVTNRIREEYIRKESAAILEVLKKEDNNN